MGMYEKKGKEKRREERGKGGVVSHPNDSCITCGVTITLVSGFGQCKSLLTAVSSTVANAQIFKFYLYLRK